MMSASVISRMAKVLAEKRAKAAQGKRSRNWREFSFDDPVAERIYMICTRYIPPNESFWNEFAGKLIEVMVEMGFHEQPSINVNDRDDLEAMRSNHRRMEEVREENQMLASVSLMQHTCNVLEQFDVDVEEGMGRTLRIKERLFVMFGCLLHDFGKSLTLNAKYNHTTTVSQTLRSTHQVLTARFIDTFYDLEMADDGLHDALRDDIGRIRDICVEHHARIPSDNLTPHVQRNDRMARLFEIRMQRSTEDEE